MLYVHYNLYIIHEREMIALTHKDECCKSSSSRVMMMSNDSYYSREGKTSD